MKVPNRDESAKRITLRNTAGKDVAFDGWCIASVDNYNPKADNGTGSGRWKERAIYVTTGGNVVCHKLGRSQLPGEVDRGQVLVIKQPLPPVAGLRGHTNWTNAQLDAAALASSDNWADAEVAEFFRGDSLAKDLLEAADIADVEVIE